MPLQPISRRSFLRGTGVTLALPWLDAMVPSGRAARQAEPPRRMVLINNELGFHPGYLFPARAGKISSTPYLDVLKDYHGDLTLCSGLSHLDVNSGHSAKWCFLTGARQTRDETVFKNTISVDQFAVERLGPDTRFPSLVLSTSGNSGLSYSRSGVGIPADDQPSVVFKKLFLNGTEEERREQQARLSRGKSLLDGIRDDLAALKRSVGPRDRDRLDQYLTSVRETEERLHRARVWATRPKPTVSVSCPIDVRDPANIIARCRLMIDLVHLALQTDSTRVVTLHICGNYLRPPIEGVTHAWHDLTHHGQDPDKLGQLKLIEGEILRVFGGLLGKLKNTHETGVSLLDQTAVLLGSSLGSASVHSNVNLPILLAGGSFKHGKYLAFGHDRNTPLCNLFVSMLQYMGLGVDRFSAGTTTLSGLVRK